MADCTDYPTPEDAKRFKNNANSTNEFVTSDSDTFVDQDGGEHITIEGIEQLAETQRDQFDATFQAQFAYKHIGNISDYVGDPLPETDKLNSYQYPDDSGNWYGPVQSQTFPITVPSDPSNDNGWVLTSGATQEWVAETVRNPNLLSNHNFLIPSPDDSQPLPSATPTSYPPGYEIFSGVFANETTGILNLTYIDGRVSFSGGDFYMSVPNTGALENITEFVASVADFDGKPRTRGVSYTLVGDEHRVTVGVDALTGAGGNDTPLGSVKFEQGDVATGHDVKSLFDIYGHPNMGIYNVKAFGAVGDKQHDDTGAFKLCYEALPKEGGRITIPTGSYLLNGEALTDGVTVGFHIPYTSNGATAGKRVHLDGDNAKLFAGSDNMHVVRISSNFNTISGITIIGTGSDNGTSGLVIAPDDINQTTKKVENTWNASKDINITACQYGIHMMCGPTVMGSTSTCYYNSFNHISVANCNVGALLSGRHHYTSSVNRNSFIDVNFHGPNMNTGVIFDGADSNKFISCDFEGINSGVTPTATPTAVYIKNTGAAGWPCSYNYFSGCVAEACNHDVYNGHQDSIFNGNEFNNGKFDGTLPALQSGQGYAEIPNDYTFNVDGVGGFTGINFIRDQNASITNVNGFDFLTFYRNGGVSFRSEDQSLTSAGVVFRETGSELVQSSHSTGVEHYSFYTTDAAKRGAITVTTSGTNYGTISDPRVKTEFVELGKIEAYSAVKSLGNAVGLFSFKDDTENRTVAGFNAHSVIDIDGLGSEVGMEGAGSRESVIGGDVTPASVDQSKAVPYLVKCLSMLIEEVEALKDEIELIRNNK